MIDGSFILSIAVVAIAVWMVMMLVRLRHKIIAIFLIALILFGYVSFNFAIDKENIDLTDFKGVVKASGIYFSWLGSFFGSTQVVTSNVVKNNSDKLDDSS